VNRTPGSLWRSTVGRELNKLKRGFLKKTLALAPGMTDKTAEWILHKWDINPRVQDDPNTFYEMLHNTGIIGEDNSTHHRVAYGSKA
jgi:hypothetical protein